MKSTTKPSSNDEVKNKSSLIPHYTFKAEKGITLSLPLNVTAMTSFSRRTVFHGVNILYMSLLTYKNRRN